MTAQEIQNNFESKISVKIEANSRGFTTSVHVYQGATKKEIDATVDKAIYAHNLLQDKLNPKVIEVVPELA